jgi:hypothetical protein
VTTAAPVTTTPVATGRGKKKATHRRHRRKRSTGRKHSTHNRAHRAERTRHIDLYLVRTSPGRG